MIFSQFLVLIFAQLLDLICAWKKHFGPVAESRGIHILPEI